MVWCSTSTRTQLAASKGHSMKTARSIKSRKSPSHLVTLDVKSPMQQRQDICPPAAIPQCCTPRLKTTACHLPTGHASKAALSEQGSQPVPGDNKDLSCIEPVMHALQHPLHLSSRSLAKASSSWRRSLPSARPGHGLRPQLAALPLSAAWRGRRRARARTWRRWRGGAA